MARIKYILAIVLLLGIVDCYSQKRLSNREYAHKYGEMAQEQMRKYGIPASVTLAQGILESAGGSSRLAVKANNHFGIKCGSSWSGKTIRHNDDRRGECFRSYSSVKDSYVDHSLFLVNGQRYSKLFRLSSRDYEGWSRGLSIAGYATNPRYADMLIGIIERDELWKYDGAKPKDKNKHKRDEPISFGYGQVNGVRYSVVGVDESLSSFSKRVGVSVKKLLKYNDLQGVVPLSKGMSIYIESKKSRSASYSSHIINRGETLHYVSQKYGVKLSNLMKMNPAYRYNQPRVGELVRLR